MIAGQSPRMSFDIVLPRLLSDARGDLLDESRRVLTGLSLSALFGLAIGARYGLASMAVHAIGVPVGFVAGAGLAAPALCIAVAHFDLPIDTRALIHALARGVAVAGVILAGLSPAALLLTMSPETPWAAALFAFLGLALGSGLGVREIARSIAPWAETKRLRLHTLLLGFVLLAAVLSVRVWWFTLPMLGRGGS